MRIEITSQMAIRPREGNNPLESLGTRMLTLPPAQSAPTIEQGASYTGPRQLDPFTFSDTIRILGTNPDPSAQQAPTMLEWFKQILNNKYVDMATELATRGFQKLGGTVPFSAVFRVGPDVVIKTGSDVQEEEATMLEYIRSRTSIPVPEVITWGRCVINGHVAIAMRFVDGLALSEVWNTLEWPERDSVTCHLRRIVMELRSQRQCYIGGIGSIPLPPAPDDGMPRKRWVPAGCTDNFFSRAAGPFPSQGDFLGALERVLRARSDEPWVNKVVIPMLHMVPSRGSMTFLTHGEFNPRNVLVKDGRVVALLDWSQAGFYPIYWEFVKAHWNILDDIDFFRDGALDFILSERYDVELAVFLHAKEIIW